MERPAAFFYSLAMKFYLARLYAEKAALWGAIGLLNAPLGFIPLGIAGLHRLHDRSRPHEEHIRSQIEDEFYQPLPDHAPLTVLCREMGEKAGVSIKNVLMRDSGEPFSNAMIYSERKSEISLFFDGDPQADWLLAESGQSEALIRGVVAHEIGHSLSHSDHSFNTAAFWTSLSYYFGAAGSLILGLGCLATGGVVAGAALAGLAVTGVAAGLTTAAIEHRFSRNEEFLADFHGARLFGADNLVIGYDFLCQYDPELPEPEPVTRLGKFIALLQAFQGSTHPTSEQRLTSLRQVFNSAASFNTPPDLDDRAARHQPPSPFKTGFF